MDKKKIDQLIPEAVKVLAETGIAKNGTTISKTFRGQISTFAAAISGGSLLAAVAFFSDNGSADVERVNLMRAIYSLLTAEKKDDKDCLFKYVEKEVKSNREKKCKEDIINAAIALKLAMNVYKLEKK